MINSLDHIIIAVQDLDTAEQQYQTLLGRECCWRGEHPGLGSANRIFRLGNTYLELVAVAGSGPFADIISQQLASKGEGLLGIAFGCRNLDSTREQLREKGVEVADIQPASATNTQGLERHWRMALLDAEAVNGLFAFLIEPEDALALPYSRLADSEGRAAVDAVDHLVIETPDADAFIARFSEQFGQRLLLDQSIEKWGVRQLFYRVGGVTLEVISRLQNPENGEENDAVSQDNLWGLALQAPDMQLLHARLATQGVAISSLREGRKKGTSVATPKSHTLGIATLLIGPAINE